jgi:hypothetical protein
MPSYLLPCKCGRRLPVTTAQAGDQLRCECGERLEVPTLRQLESLERLEGATPVRQKSWGLRQSLIFLGVAILVLAAAGLVALQFTKPQPIREPVLRVAVENMTSGELWKSWVVLQQGIHRQLLPGEVAILQQKQIQIEGWAAWEIATFVVAGIGGLLIVVGFSLRPSQRRSRVPARS